ncbi:MAG: hypothetical protein AAF203_00910 [Pseudomonadota bacterium]
MLIRITAIFMVLSLFAGCGGDNSDQTSHDQNLFSYRADGDIADTESLIGLWESSDSTFRLTRESDVRKLTRVLITENAVSVATKCTFEDGTTLYSQVTSVARVEDGDTLFILEEREETSQSEDGRTCPTRVTKTDPSFSFPSFVSDGVWRPSNLRGFGRIGEAFIKIGN